MEIVQELANLCSIAIFSYHIMKDYDFRDLKRIISGSIYSNCWVIIEEFNNLQHEAIQIICREILILQQKYILAEINNESEINMKIIIKHSEENQEQDIKQNKTICSKISKDEFEIIKDDISNSELNSNYFKNFDSLEGEKAIINFQETNEEKNTIPSNTKKSTKKDIERVAHGLFITYNENISTLNELPTLKAQKIGNLQSCFRYFIFLGLIFFFFIE